MRRRRARAPAATQTPREDLTMVLLVLMMTAFGATAPPDSAAMTAQTTLDPAPVDLRLRQDADGLWRDDSGAAFQPDSGAAFQPDGGALRAGSVVALDLPGDHPPAGALILARRLMAQGLQVRIDLHDIPPTTQETR